MSRVPKDEDPRGNAPIRLGAREEVHPLRLVVPVRRLDPSAPGPALPAPAPFAPSGASAPAATRPAAAPPPPRWDGAAIRAAREAAGFTLPRLAERTRLPRATLEAIEAQRVERLPRAYLKGFLSAIAKELRLDGREVTRSYLDAIRPPPPPDDAPPGAGPIR